MESPNELPQRVRAEAGFEEVAAAEFDFGMHVVMAAGAALVVVAL